MKSIFARAILTLPVLATSLAHGAADPLALTFDGGADGWRVVVDGVMGGRSSGRVGLAEPGVLRFTGDLSLENNGGFSQVRTAVSGDQFDGAKGLEIKFLGDGRTYQFDIRCSNVRMMAGGFQQTFETKAGEWMTVRLAFDGFRLYSFGRRVPNPPALDPARIESIGVTLADKNPGAFELQIDSIRAFGDDSPAPATTGNDLASVASRAGLDTLLRLVGAADLELPSDQRVTIFAPSEEAFGALPEATVRGLLTPEGKETLRAILTYHVTTPAMTSSELLSRRSVSTLNGQRLDIGASGPVSIGGAGVVAMDVPFDGGVVHVIDTVLMPELDSISAAAAKSDQLTTLVAALDAAGLVDQLGSENGPWTVFAPVDSAFANLPSGALDDLLRPENRAKLIGVLAMHVVPGRLYANEFLANRRAQTFLGASIGFGIDAGRLRVDGASFVATDIEAGNGVIHLIDTVLLPAEPEVISAEISAEGARLCELAINRGAPLFNAGQVAACASIYEVAMEAMVALAANDLGRGVVQRLELGLAEGETKSNWSDRAWVYRQAIDETYARLVLQAQPDGTSASR